MEPMIRDDVSGKRVRHEVSEMATAGELLQEACALFGREELDSALEVDGAVVCTGVSAEGRRRSAAWGCTRTAAFVPQS